MRALEGKPFGVLCLAALLLAGSLSCGGSALRAQRDTVGELIERARGAGAIRCAPVELAMAESHHDFAGQELAEGNFYRARNEVAIAEENAHAAIAKSPPERCAEGAGDGDLDGDGIPDVTDDCPAEAEDEDGFQDADGCPDPDNDGDGLADTIDDCPDEPEDKDGVEDQDGCPEADDRDGDGLADSIDQCPTDPEDKDGFQDDDGCPDCDDDGDGVPECPKAIDRCPTAAAKTPDGCPRYKNVTVTKDKIELSQTIYFDTARATIKRVSHDLLNEVARALADNPKIRVRIEGHTDSRGGDDFNMRLSQDRAEAVRRYLIERGISPSRMAAQGFGETMPIADNRTRSGREQNRRVEFVIIDR